MILPAAFNVSAIFSMVAWFGAVLWGIPAFWRTIGKRARTHDDTRAAVSFVALNIVWFQARKFIFGAHRDAIGTAETAYWTAAMAFSVVSALLIVAVVNRHERER